MLLSLLSLVALAPQGETTVTAARSVHASTVSASALVTLESEDLERTGERSIPRAIAKAAGYAGVWLQETNLGGGSPFIRGLTGNHVLVVIDGVRLNDSTTRFGPNQNLNTISPAIVERVEILRGAASVLYGSDAIGGAILIWTKDRAPSAENPGYQSEFNALYGSAQGGGRASLGVSHANKRFGWLLLADGATFDDLKAGDNETQSFTGYDSREFFGSLHYALDDSRSLRITGSQHTDIDVPRTDRVTTGFGQTMPAFSVFRFAEQKRSRWVATYRDDSARGFADSFQIRASVRQYDERRERQATGSATFRTEQDRIETLGLSLDMQKALGEDHLLTYGFDLDHDRVKSSRVDLDTGTSISTPRDGAFAPGSRFTSAGVFIQDEIFSLAPTDVTVGVRYSYFDFSFDEFGAGPRQDGNFNALTASVSAGRDLNENVRLVGTLAQGFRAPNLADLAKDGSFGGGDELHNPNLEPEQSLSAELALELNHSRVQGSFAIFGTQLDDAIGRTLINAGDPNVTGDETYLRENQGEVRLYGAELGGRAQIAEDSPFFVEASIAAIAARQFDDENPSLDNVPWRRTPPLHGRVAVAWEPTQAGQSSPANLDRISLEAPWADDQGRLHPQDISDPRIGEATAGWTVWNLDLSGPIDRKGASEWHLGLHNILDARYRIHGSGFDAPGRSLILGVRMSF